MQPRICRQSYGSVFLLLLAILSIVSIAAASTPTSFCKCTCFSNSTIIPLDPSKSSSGADTSGIKLYERALNTIPEVKSEPVSQLATDHDGESTSESNSEADILGTLVKRAQQYRALSCNDCNRKFCLDYELPICKDAKEEDVFTTCFQRDSRKDEAVVFIFIFATGGLLTWALLKPWIERYLEAARERRAYVPVGDPES